MTASVADPAATRDLRLRRAELAIITAMVYLTASLILVLPAYTLASGVRAAGDAAGLWIGDVNSAGGEETWALAWGILLVSAGLVISALVLRMLGRRYSLSAVPSIVAGTVVVLAWVSAVCAGVVAAVPEAL